jgi:hypothetical protein
MIGNYSLLCCCDASRPHVEAARRLDTPGVVAKSQARASAAVLRSVGGCETHGVHPDVPGEDNHKEKDEQTVVHGPSLVLQLQASYQTCHRVPVWAFGTFAMGQANVAMHVPLFVAHTALVFPLCKPDTGQAEASSIAAHCGYICGYVAANITRVARP